MKTSVPPTRLMMIAILVALLIAAAGVFVFAGRVEQPVENSLAGEELPET